MQYTKGDAEIGVLPETQVHDKWQNPGGQEIKCRGEMRRLFVEMTYQELQPHVARMRELNGDPYRDGRKMADGRHFFDWMRVRLRPVSRRDSSFSRFRLARRSSIDRKNPEVQRQDAATTFLALPGCHPIGPKFTCHGLRVFSHCT